MLTRFVNVRRALARISLLWGLAVGMGLQAGHVQAAINVMDLSGFQKGSGGAVPQGTALTGTLLYNTGVAPTNSGGFSNFNWADYALPSYAGFLTAAGVGTWNFNNTPSTALNLATMRVYDGFAGRPDEIDIYLGLTGPSLQAGGFTWIPDYAILSLQAGSDQLLSSTAAPLSLDSNNFPIRYLSLGFQRLDAQGAPTQLFAGQAFMDNSSLFSFSTSAIPEPGEWAMLLAGLSTVGVIAKRRGKQRVPRA